MLLPSGSSEAKYGMYHTASIANRNGHELVTRSSFGWIQSVFYLFIYLT